MRHSGKRVARRNSADECIAPRSKLKKVTHRYCIPKEHQQTQQPGNVSNEGRQSNRGDYTCPPSSCNVAGFSLGVVAVVAGMFELVKVDASTEPLGKKLSSAPMGMLNGDDRVPQFLEQRKSQLILGDSTLATQRWWC